MIGNTTTVFRKVNTRVVCNLNTFVLNSVTMKLNYGDRLRTARKHRKLSQNQLAELSGVGQGTISKIERGEQGDSAANIKLAMALDISPVWLSEGDARFVPEWLTTGIIHGKMGDLDGCIEGNISNRYNVNSGPDVRGLVPLISSIRAGEWCETQDIIDPANAEEWFPCPVKHSKYTYCLRVEGDSMTNTIPGQKSYPEGTIIFVDPDRIITNGCRVIAKLPNCEKAVFKEYREDGGKRFLKPLNQQYTMQEINDETRLCGVVIFSGWPE